VVRRFDAGPLRCVPPNASRDTTLNTNRPSLRLFLLPLASQLALYPRRGVHAQHVHKLRPHDGPLQPCIPLGGFRWWWRRIATTNSNRTTKNKDSDDHAWSNSTYSPGPPQGSGRDRRSNGRNGGTHQPFCGVVLSVVGIVPTFDAFDGIENENVVVGEVIVVVVIGLHFAREKGTNRAEEIGVPFLLQNIRETLPEKSCCRCCRRERRCTRSTGRLRFLIPACL